MSAIPPVAGAIAGSFVLGQVGRTSAAPEGGFAAVLGQLAAGVADTLRNGEQAAVAGIQQAISPQEAVEAILAAERHLQTALSIRDKAVAALQEISRMSV